MSNNRIIPEGFWSGDEDDEGNPIRPIPHDKFRFRINKRIFRLRFENESEENVDIVIERKEPLV